MKTFQKLGACLLCTSMLLGGCGSKNTHGLDADKPVTLTLWHYYNGAQKDALDKLVEEFNTTEGKENGVIIDAVAKNSISNIASDLHDSLEKKPSAEAMPNMFMAYQDTAQELMDRKKLVSLETYMSKDELKAYVSGFLNDGRYFGSDETKLFPVAKASEVMIINKNEWTKFANAEHIDETDLETWEGLQKTAERYYIYSGGKAFFSRDAIANYLITGSKQFKDELFTQKKDKTVFSVSDETMRKLWDNYYIPFVKGYYVKNGRFASDDIKTKDVIASVSSTASGTFFPKEVIDENGNSEAVNYLVLPVPDFKGTKDTAISQGGGIAWMPKDADDFDTLVKYADFAMYEVKNYQKGGIRSFSKDNYLHNNLLFDGRQELLNILDEERVQYAFQPIVNARDGSILGYEALMRPISLILKTPLDIMWVARTQKQLYRVERMTWIQALKQFSERVEKGTKHKIFINSIPSIPLLEDIKQQLEEQFHDFLGNVVIELLESEEIEASYMQTKQEFCKRWNAQTALDDFGSGYSSDHRLLSNQTNYVKIDMEFVRNIALDKERQMLVKNVLEFAHSRGIQVIAEGVESYPDMKYLIQNGIDYLQGYYLGKPEFDLQDISEAVKVQIRKAQV